MNMDEKVQIKNLCSWEVGFKRIDGVGDITIPPNTTIRIPRGEIYSQVQSGNTMLSGTDGHGSHARIYILDKATRVDLEFENEDGKVLQAILDDKKLKEIFAIKTINAFKKSVEDSVVTSAEKMILVNAIEKFKINEYDKIAFIKEYTQNIFNF